MANHEFGIMPHDPAPDRRYDEYEPQRYNCITVDDEDIEPLLTELQKVDCYWHTLRQPGKGLAYCGITLIPPTSLALFHSLLSGAGRRLEALIHLTEKAQLENRYIIHFGI